MSPTSYRAAPPRGGCFESVALHQEEASLGSLDLPTQLGELGPQLFRALGTFKHGSGAVDLRQVRGGMRNPAWRVGIKGRPTTHKEFG